MPVPISTLFVDEPPQWGLRGDPLLWREMQERLTSVDLPDTPEQLCGIIEAVFQELTGHPISHRRPLHVERYRHQGMSSGMIDPEFWRARAIPLLHQRFAARRRMLRLARRGKALILVGAATPCIAAALMPEAAAGRLDSRGAVAAVLAAAIATILLGLALSARALRARPGPPSWRILLPPVFGLLVAIMYLLTMAQIFVK